jgi:hypothetical protein
VGEGDDRQPRAGPGDDAGGRSLGAGIGAAGPEVDGQCPHPILEEQGGRMIAQQGRDLIAVGRPQGGLVGTALGQPDRTDDPLGELVREQDARQAQSNQPGQRGESRRDERDQGDPLDRSLPPSGSATLARR